MCEVRLYEPGLIAASIHIPMSAIHLSGGHALHTNAVAIRITIDVMKHHYY